MVTQPPGMTPDGHTGVRSAVRSQQRVQVGTLMGPWVGVAAGLVFFGIWPKTRAPGARVATKRFAMTAR